MSKRFFTLISVFAISIFLILLTHKINLIAINKQKEIIAKKIFQLRKETLPKNIKSQSYTIKDNVVISKFLTKNKSITFYDKINLTPLKHIVIINTLIVVIMSLIILALIFFFISFLLSRFRHIKTIITHIKKREFDKLPPIKKANTICDEFQNELVSLAKEIQTYTKLLSLKIENYKKKAYIDELTHAFNRTFLDEISKKIFFKAQISSTPTSIIMIDIDNFKKINDTFGHDIGDEVLKHISLLISKNIRKEDLLIRYGGEEFLIILNETDKLKAKQIAQKLVKKIANTPFKELKVTISAGVSQILYKDKNLLDAIKRADIKLYQAKQNGKNQAKA